MVELLALSGTTAVMRVWYKTADSYFCLPKLLLGWYKTIYTALALIYVI